MITPERDLTDREREAMELLLKMPPQTRALAAQILADGPRCSKGMFAASECDDPVCPRHRPEARLDENDKETR